MEQLLFHLIITSPLGPRKGQLRLHSRGGAELSGSLTLPDQKAAVTGTRLRPDLISVSGQMRTSTGAQLLDGLFRLQGQGVTGGLLLGSTCLECTGVSFSKSQDLPAASDF